MDINSLFAVADPRLRRETLMEYKCLSFNPVISMSVKVKYKINLNR